MVTTTAGDVVVIGEFQSRREAERARDSIAIELAAEVTLEGLAFTRAGGGRRYLRIERGTRRQGWWALVSVGA